MFIQRCPMNNGAVVGARVEVIVLAVSAIHASVVNAVGITTIGCVSVLVTDLNKVYQLGCNPVPGLPTTRLVPLGKSPVGIAFKAAIVGT